MICAQCRHSMPAGDGPCPACGQDPRLDGRFRLLSVLGEGERTTTFEAALPEEPETRLVIKELLVRRVGQDKHRALFERESNVLRGLRHPAVPAHREAFIAGRGKLTALYSVREYVEGRTLLASRSGTKQSSAELQRIGAALLDVLADLHRLSPPVVHRDVSLCNVLERADGHLMLIDFGASRASGIEPGSTVAGTFGTMAPETLEGRAVPASDVYSVGALLVSLAAGMAPGDLRLKGPLSPRAHIANRRLASVVARMLRPEPRDRGSASELAAALRALDRPRRAPWLAIAAAALGLVVAGVYVAVPSAPAPTAEARPAAEPAPKPAEPGPTPSEPALPSLPRLTRGPDTNPSACGERGDCADLEEGFLGLTLREQCGPLVASPRSATQVQRDVDRTIEVDGHPLHCVADWQRTGFCNVLCTAQIPAHGLDSAFAWVRDRYGPARESIVHPPSRTIPGFPPLPVRRSLRWGSESRVAPGLLASGRASSNRSMTLTLSYRGDFRG